MINKKIDYIIFFLAAITSIILGIVVLIIIVHLFIIASFSDFNNWLSYLTTFSSGFIISMYFLLLSKKKINILNPSKNSTQSNDSTIFLKKESALLENVLIKTLLTSDEKILLEYQKVISGPLKITIAIVLYAIAFLFIIFLYGILIFVVLLMICLMVDLLQNPSKLKFIVFTNRKVIAGTFWKKYVLTYQSIESIKYDLGLKSYNLEIALRKEESKLHRILSLRVPNINNLWNEIISVLKELGNDDIEIKGLIKNDKPII